MIRALVIEDTASLALSYAGQLESAGYAVDIAITAGDATTRIASAGEPYDVVLLDLQLPDRDGLELLADIPELARHSSVIVVTADGSVDRAIDAMRLGAYDFLVKPLAPDRLMTTVRNAAERQALAREVLASRARKDRDHFQGFLGRSNVMQALYRAIENVADSQATIFVTGESGTGKEVTAEAIHRSGRRASRPMIAINCGAIPENLLESELFGHVKGAFTGAVDHRIGAAREADGGTLFLDEICEMELKLQVKLLRFLQTGMIQRVGSSKAEAVNVRVICATNRDPAAEVAAGRFREDLFYRLAVIPLEVPPLRDRGSDIDLLAGHFLRKFAQEEGKPFTSLPDDVCAALRARAWPGNVRELQNLMRRVVVMEGRPEISLSSLPPMVQASLPWRTAGGPVTAEPADAPHAPASANVFAGLSLDRIERLAIENAIAESSGSLPGAARRLGVSPSTIYRKIERWQVQDRSPADLLVA